VFSANATGPAPVTATVMKLTGDSNNLSGPFAWPPTGTCTANAVLDTSYDLNIVNAQCNGQNYEETIVPMV
jgi:hypothetical protein